MSKDDAEILAQLVATFRVEAAEHLQAMNAILLELEKGKDADANLPLIENLFREAHSLKGAARAVDAGSIESIAHGLESVFAASKRQKTMLAPVLYDLLYESLDQISASLDSSDDEQDSDEKLKVMCARLDEAAGSLGKGSKKVQTGQSVKTKKTMTSTRQNKNVVPTEDTIRVSTRKLDALMTHVEELLVSKIRNEQRLAELKELRLFLENWQKSWLKTRVAFDSLRRRAGDETDEILDFLGENQQNLKSMWHLTNKLHQNYSRDTMRMSLITEDMQTDIRRVRMLPVSIIFDGFGRMVRDLAREQGKQVELVVSGSGTEFDKKVIESIKDPLMHMLRNSIDHGIDKPDVRIAKGKPPCGTIWLRATQQGNGILVDVEDDGNGIDVERIKETALARGVLNGQEIGAMSDEDLRHLIFRSGFSTASTISSVSGRGVGLDVVKTNIEGLNGLINVTKEESGGTKFSITLPLTLSTSRVLLVKCADGTYAIPTAAVERIVRVKKKDIFTVGTKETVEIGGHSLSLARLGDILELPRGGVDRDEKMLNVVILGAAEKRVALAVDSLVGENEIVIKNLGKMMVRVRNVAGATVLGTGKVIMILNVADLIKSAKKVSEKPGDISAVLSDTEPEKNKSVLVVDDSITARTLEKNILESAGYDVLLANDGLEALTTLKTNHCDLVISDVDMPNMNGFDLTHKVKNDASFQDIPVILVTALGSPADRERGLESGADAYITKHSFDQKKFLNIITQLV